MVIASMMFAIWGMLPNGSNSEAIDTDIMLAVPAGLGIGWAVFQAIFVRKKRIKAQGGIGFVELILLSIQATGIVLVSLFILLWIKVI